MIKNKIKETSGLLLIFTLVVSISGCHNASSVHTKSAEQQSVEESFQQSEISVEADDESTSDDYEASSVTATDIVNSITVGYNIGNTLDSCPTTGRNDGTYPPSYFETNWGNPVITPEYIAAIKTAGFNALRLPVTWYYNTYFDENVSLAIQTGWLERVAEVVNYALAENMYVILDSHHDGSMIWADMNDMEEVSSNVQALWTQIARYFKDYDYRLIFEGFNEINTKDTSWKYTESSAQAANILNQIFVDTVRGCGGNNADRILVCDTYLSSASDDALNSFQLPSDTVADKLIASVHYYDSCYNQDIDSNFQKLYDFSNRINAPVVIGEFGTTTGFVPSEYRARHAGNYIAHAKKYGIKCFWWDDGGGYSLIDRNSVQVIESSVVASLMNPSEFNIEKISVNTYNTKDSYVYADIDSSTGLLIDSSQGVLTLNPTENGLAVIQGNSYRMELSVLNEADGLSMMGIAFYDAEQQLIQYLEISRSMTYDVTPPEGTMYMRVMLYNPWGYRSADEYNSYLENGNLELKITEYHK